MNLKRAIIPSGIVALLGVAYAMAQVLPQPGPPSPIACAYNTTPPTLTDGQAGWVQCGADGSLLFGTVIATIPANQSVNVAQINAVTPLMGNGVTGTGSPRVTIASNNTPFEVRIAGDSFTNITTNTDTNVKASAGTLVGLVVNTAGTTSTVALYNDADGTCSSGLIGTFSTTAQTSLTINATASVGICATTAGGAAADITILWR